MECAYPPCHKPVDQPLTGRKKRYCSEAHKHVDYRRRHPEKALKSRIYLLERFAKDHAHICRCFEKQSTTLRVSHSSP